MRRISILLLFLLVAPAGSKETAKRVLVVQNEDLRRELLAMFADDQKSRITMITALGECGFSFEAPTSNLSPRLLLVMLTQQWRLSQQDATNRNRLMEIIKEYGWPGKSLVGVDGANAAWLLVQHADADVAFQRKCLSLMETAPEGEVSCKDVAYLTDRVLVNEHKKQKYGTQMGMNFEPQPIDDADSVDERRAEIGLPPLAEYVKDAREQYNKMLKQKPAK